MRCRSLTSRRFCPWGERDANITGVTSTPANKATARNVRTIRIILLTPPHLQIGLWRPVFRPATDTRTARKQRGRRLFLSGYSIYSAPPAPRCRLRSAAAALTDHSPVEDTSSAPVRSRTSLARFTSSDELQCTDR